MKQSSKLFKFVGLLLVVGLLFAALPNGQVLAQTQPYDPDTAIQKAADEIVNSQAARGDWVDAYNPVPDTLGVIGSGLIDAYTRTADPHHLTSIQAAATYLLTKINNFSPADGMFAAKLDALLGVNTYKAFVKANFFDKLAAGTYGATGDQDTADYIATLNSYMNSQDPALGLISAHLCGADTSLWIAEVKSDLGAIAMGSDSEPMLMASKGIYSLFLVGETFDPTTGSFAAAGDLAEMAAQLATYQLTDGSFPNNRDWYESGVQATASAILALDQVNSSFYQNRIRNAANWLLSVQNVAGYWIFGGSENYASTAMSALAVNEAFPSVAPEMPCTADCYVSPSGLDTNLGNAATPFLTIQKAIDTVAAGGTVNVVAGTYNEDLEIGKSITILGPNEVISPNGSMRDPEAIVAPLNEISVADPAVLITAPNITVTIKGLTFDMMNTLDDSDRFVELMGKAGVTLDVQNNQFLNAPACINGNWYITGTTNMFKLTLVDNYFTGSKSSNGIALWGDGHTVDIRDNVWKDNTGWIVNFSNITGTFSGNTILDTVSNGTNLVNGQGGLYLNQSNNLTLTSNTFNGLAKANIFFNNNFSGTLNATGNTFSGLKDPTRGVIRIWDGADLSGVKFEGNKFLNNPIVAQNLDVAPLGVALNALGNWFGSAVGPAAGSLSGAVSYIPWCGEAECTTTVYPPTKLNMALTTTPVANTCASSQTVEVNVQEVTGLTGYDLTVNFEASKVQVTKVENGGWLNATGALIPPTNVINNVDGNVTFALTQQGTGGDAGPKTGSGSLIKITFTPLVPGPLTFSIDAAKSMLVSWPDVQPIPFAITGGANFTLGAVVKNVNTSVEYCALDTAVAAAVSGQKLQLLADNTVAAKIDISKTLSLDTNGKTATRTGTTSAYDSLFNVITGGDLTVTGLGTLNSTSAGSNYGAAVAIVGGKLTLVDATLSGDYVSLRVQGNQDAATWATPLQSLFTMTSGTLKDGMVIVGNGADATINGGTITTQVGGFAPITGNGTVSGTTNNGGTKITITGGTIISPDNYSCAIYHPQDGVLTINGGTITGYNGVEMKAGDLTVIAGTITGTGAFVATPPPTGNGSTNTGDAILIYSRAGYTGDLTVNISGGTITSTNGYALREYTLDTPTRTTSVAVTGGKFTGGTVSAGAVSFTNVAPDILKLTGGAYNTDPGAMPDYVFEPLNTYRDTDTYYYIDKIVSGTIAAYDLPNGSETVTDNAVDFLGDIPWYNADVAAGRIQGNRVGVYITAPADVNLTNATVHVQSLDVDVNWTWAQAKDAPNVDVFSLWKLITQVPQTTVITIKWNPVSTQVFTVNVQTDSILLQPPAPSLTASGLGKLFVTGLVEPFTVTLSNPLDGANYSNVIVHVHVEATVNPLATLEYENEQTPGVWETLPLTPEDGGFGVDFGPTGGFPMAAGYSDPTDFKVNFVAGGTYPVTLTLKDLAPTAIYPTLVTQPYSVKVYTAPTINTADLAGPFQQGVANTVTFAITNPDDLPGPFDLVLNLPEGTEVRYGTDPVTTVICTSTGCVIPVSLPAALNSIALQVTFNAPYNGPASANLMDTSTDPGRAVATYATTTDVVVLGSLNVTGTVSMQGRLVRNGVPVTLTGPDLFAYGPYTVTSTNASSNNYAFTAIAANTYVFTTKQARYLNVSASVVVDATKTLPVLVLKGGNAFWNVDGTVLNNRVDIGDATLVGSQYSKPGTSDPFGNNGDCNFDGIVNIQDLTLVGGNFDLQSYSSVADGSYPPAYPTWVQ